MDDSALAFRQAGVRLHRLSGGQRRRVDVAIGIVGRPELLFLDEPTTGFDPQARRQFWELIAGLSHDGTTILLTTHYLDEAEALARRVAVLASGRIADRHTSRSGRISRRGHGQLADPRRHSLGADDQPDAVRCATGQEF